MISASTGPGAVTVSPKFLKFLAIGALSYVMSVGLTSIFLLWTSPSIAYLLTLFLVFCTNYSLARRWIFRSTHNPVVSESIKFLVASVVFQGLDWLIFVLTIHLLHFPFYVGIFCSKILIIPIKYTIYQKKVFHGSPSLLDPPSQ